MRRVNEKVPEEAERGSTVYAGGYFSGIGYFPQSYIAAIGGSTVDVPDAKGTGGVALLEQNEPNPFGNDTVIRFSLATEDEVTLGAYDLAGRGVAILLPKERLEPGWHQVDFSGRKLTSGVYLLRLQTRRTTLARKIVVLH